jgi:hypothetical protein
MIDEVTWCCQSCGRPVIDRDPYALDHRITPFATIGDLMGGVSVPAIWRPFARRRWIRRLEERVARELRKHRDFEIVIGVAGKERSGVLKAAKEARERSLS